MAKLRNALKILFECGVKLESNLQTISLAAVYFHRFYRVKSSSQFDPYIIGATCIYLASKVEEDNLRLRDIINVFHSTLNKKCCYQTLEMNNFFWDLRNTIVDCELIILRVLKFKTHYVYPHKYLLYYLRSLLEWIGKSYTVNQRIALTCWSLLNDYYIDPKCIDNTAKSIAIAVIIIGLRLNEIAIPYNEEAVTSWINSLDTNISNDEVWTVVSNIISIYDETSPSGSGIKVKASKSAK